RVPGAAPRTSTPQTAPPSASTTVQPVGRRASVKWPTERPATAVSPEVTRSVPAGRRAAPRPFAPQGPRRGPFGPLGAATEGSVGATAGRRAAPSPSAPQGPRRGPFGPLGAATEGS